MANGFELDPFRGADQASIDRLRQSQMAQSELGALMQSPERQQAMQRSQAQMQGPNALGFLANMLQRSGGRADLEKMKTQADALRGTVRQGIGAQEEIDRGTAGYEDLLERQGKKEERDFTLKKTMDQQAYNEGKRKRVSFINPDEPDKDLQLETDGRGRWFKGNEELDPNIVAGLTESGRRAKGMTSSQVQGGLSKLGKRLAPLERTKKSISDLLYAIKPYAKGGEKEGDNIPGIGRFEGGQLGGQLYRAMSSEAQGIHAILQQTTNAILKEVSGAAVTSAETLRHARALSTTELNDEQAVIEAILRLQKSIENDINNVKNTTSKDVLGSYYENTGGEEFSTFGEREKLPTLDFGYKSVYRKEDEPKAKPSSAGWKMIGKRRVDAPEDL